jgi:hypothetical protein
MKHHLIALLFVPLFLSNFLSAGTLENAPFQIVPPSPEWKLDDSTSQPLGKEAYLVASLSNKKASLNSVVCKGTVKISPTALDEICAGMRKSFTSPSIKILSDAETNFLGYKSRTFALEMTQAGETIYTETTVFVTADTSWTFIFTGSVNKKEAVKQIATYFHRK